MKKFLLFMFVAFALAGCEQAPIDEAQGVTTESNRSLEVSFEGADETRIQLQDDKSVWTKGDLVSVFYRSTTNEKWQFMGETGDRTGQIVPVDNSVNPPATQNSVVVVYPYNEDYFFNTDTYNVEASLPAVQSYMKDSYGMNGNIMISSSEFNKVSLKSVCGWLKLQLTGNGEVVKSITLRGNNGEQVAGLIYVNSADATAILASTEEEVGDEEVGGTLVRPGAIITDVTLDCGEGVELGTETTTFFIALPPQTFAQGLTVEITDDSAYTMTQTTEKSVAIARNTIQPMATFVFVNPNNQPTKPTQPTPASNEIWYTASKECDPYYDDKYTFGANVVSNVWDATTGKGIITFDGEVTMIGEKAFYNCSKIETINIPDSVTSIGNQAFYYCSSLTHITIPDSVTTIENKAFYCCESLTEVTIPNNVTKIGEWAFWYCESLTQVTIGDSVTMIGNSAFRNCSILKQVTIGNSVKTIGTEAFRYCYNLKQVTIGDSVTTISDHAFAGCSKLTQITIPNSVTTIGYAAFYDCSNLACVTIGDNVTTIGKEAFYDCSSLTEVTIGDSVTMIENKAFSNCSSLMQVTIPNSVTTIGEYAFSNCSNLMQVTIGDRVTTIGNSTFYSCSSLTHVAIPDSVATIGEYAFAFCTSLTQVTIPDSVTTIGISAFYSCNNLTQVTIGDSVTTIEEATFAGCSSLTQVTIPDSVTTIGDCVFEGCTSLTEVKIPNNATSIGYKVFAGCVSLKQFIGKFAEDNGRCLIIDNTIFAYAEASGNTYTIPNSVTTIGYEAFYKCSSLTEVTIPDSVTTIVNNAFLSCSSLTKVTIGDSVTKIGEKAFAGCQKLKYVYCKPTTPPTLGGWYVFNSNASGRRIIVPIGSGEVYKKASRWSEYANSIFEDEF